MQVLSILVALVILAVIVLVLRMALLAAIDAIWAFWPLIVGVVAAVILWRAGHDNLGVIVGLACLGGQIGWLFSPWSSRVNVFRPYD